MLSNSLSNWSIAYIILGNNILIHLSDLRRMLLSSPPQSKKSLHSRSSCRLGIVTAAEAAVLEVFEVVGVLDKDAMWSLQQVTLGDVQGGLLEF